MFVRGLFKNVLTSALEGVSISILHVRGESRNDKEIYWG